MGRKNRARDAQAKLQETVPLLYEDNVYATDEAGVVIMDEVDGVAKPRLLHAKGDPVTTADGQPVMQDKPPAAEEEGGDDEEDPLSGNGEEDEPASTDSAEAAEAPPGDTEQPDTDVAEPAAEAGDPAPEAEVVTSEAAAGDSQAEDQVEGAKPVAPRGQTEHFIPMDEAPFLLNEATKPATVAQPEPEPEPEVPEAPVSEVKEENLSLAALREQLAGKLPEDALQAWDRDTLLAYKERGLQPAKTKRGEWQVDLRRSRELKSWNPDVFLDWLDGNIILPKGILEEDVYDEIYRRYGIPANWTYEAAVTYINGGGKPAYTSTNVLIDDRMRDLKSLSYWTFLEIRTALLGEISSKFSKEELITALRTRLGLSETYSATRLLDNLTDTPTEATVDNTLLKSKLDEYLSVMTKNPVHLTDATAGKAQTMLYRTIRQVMQRDTVGFHEGWCILLDFINENYNKVFIPERARKGWNMLGISGGAAATFEDLMTLMIHTRVPNTRVREAKIYNLPTILRHVTSEQERMNVIQFYAPAQ